MSYYLDAENFSLDDLRKRLESTDLVPSRSMLLEGIQENFAALKQHGFATLAQLRKTLKAANRIEAVARETGIAVDYLILLRREYEGYFPKACPLKDFDALSLESLKRLADAGICNTLDLHQAANSTARIAALAEIAQVDASTLNNLVCLADLCRVQWVSATAARMLFEAGYHTAASLAATDAEVLDTALVRVNAQGKYFKGKIGLRDVKRLIHAAAFVP